MSYTRRSVEWAENEPLIECSCGCGVYIKPKPTWYYDRHTPGIRRFIKGHGSKSSIKAEKSENRTRPSGLIVVNRTLEAKKVSCKRCGSRWQVCPTMVQTIRRGCSFCYVEDAIVERTLLGVPVWPEDDVDEAEGAVEMSVRTYNLLKSRAPETMQELADHIRNGTFEGGQLTSAEIRDILDQCGLSETYI